MNPEHAPLLPMFEGAANCLPADTGTFGEFRCGHGAAGPARGISILRKSIGDGRQDSELLHAPSLHRFDIRARELGATTRRCKGVRFHVHWIPLATGAGYFFRIDTFCSCKSLRRSSYEVEVDIGTAGIGFSTLTTTVWGDGLEGGVPLP